MIVIVGCDRPIDGLTAYFNAEIRKSPLTAYRLGKTPQPTIDSLEERLRQRD